ncbi:hypothetical protein CMI37_27635 [Candidatus Pacearchaeota archaeon]|nr:hypothetical protein [Candidatus Pacearchaeota archaeon]
MPHISFSELRNWKRCPFYHKLTYIDKIDGFVGNEFTAFGRAIHDSCEKLLLEGDDGNIYTFFLDKFAEEVKTLLLKDVDLKQDLVDQMLVQGENILPSILPGIQEHFEEFEVISTEEQLMVPIEEVDGYKFKGFVDLVIKTPDDKYHIIDWKSCSWGWDSRKRSDPMVTYQLTLYKHYFAKKHKIDPKNIETHFALLKRTAKKDNVELFRVTSGSRKTQNALNLLLKAVYNISKKRFIKNRLACAKCEFYKTENCP